MKGLFTILFIGLSAVALHAQHAKHVAEVPKSKIVVSLDTTIEKKEITPPVVNNQYPVPVLENNNLAATIHTANKQDTLLTKNNPTTDNTILNKPAKVTSVKISNNSLKNNSSSIKASSSPIIKSVAKTVPKTNSLAGNANCKVPYPKGYSGNKGYKTIPLAGQKSYYGEMDEYVMNFTKQYLQAHNKTINAVQERGTKSFPLMEHQLKSHNIPKELKYLAVIESALNNHAVSPAGAVGPWQLMSSTAKLLGLKVSRKKDERKDWDRSTGAAAKYLSTLYDQLNDWLLVIAAYNSGPSPVQRAIEKTGSHNFWDIKPYLPRETQGHVLAFIATASIFENLNKFIGLGEVPEDMQFDGEGKPMAEDVATLKPLVPEKDKKAPAAAPKNPYTMEELEKMCIIEISEPLSMELIAQELNIDLKLLHKWNPDYQLFVYNTYPSKDYKLRIPKDKLDNFVKQKDHLEKRSKQLFKELTM